MCVKNLSLTFLSGGLQNGHILPHGGPQRTSWPSWAKFSKQKCCQLVSPTTPPTSDYLSDHQSFSGMPFYTTPPHFMTRNNSTTWTVGITHTFSDFCALGNQYLGNPNCSWTTQIPGQRQHISLSAQLSGTLNEPHGDFHKVLMRVLCPLRSKLRSGMGLPPNVPIHLTNCHNQMTGMSDHMPQR